MAATQPEVLQQMKTRIEQIEKLGLELKQLGQGVPVIEKNTRNILSAVYVLKFGISDVVEIGAA
jgi:hypothetical protein